MKILAKNKRAFADYEIVEQCDAGIELKGWEVKSIKEGNVHLKEAYVSSYKNEMWVYGMHVAKWRFATNIEELVEVRTRKLLLHRREIDRLGMQSQRQGLTLVPLEVFVSRGKIKLKIALGRGRKLHDKRQQIKERDQKRDIQRDLKRIGY